MVTDVCSTPTVTCNRWDLLSPTMRQWFLIQLLNYLNGQLGGTQYSITQLKAAAQGWICQGSPSKIQEQWMNVILDNGLGDALNTDQPVCWTPLELEGALAYIICQSLATGAPQIL